MRKDRRAFIKTAVSGGTALSLAGCTGDGNGGGNGGDGSSGGTDTPSADTETSTGNGDEPVGQEREITVAHYVGESHPFRASLDPWMELVEERTNLTINEQGGGALGGADEMLSLVQNQTAEVATIAPADYGSRLAASNIFNLPGTYEDRVEAEKRCWELVRGVLYEEEWSPLGLEPLTSQAMGPYYAESADGRIEDLSDWEGRAVRSPGGIMSSTIETLGGTPTEIAHNQADAFQRGIIDSNIHPPHASVSNDLVQFFDAAETSVHLGAFSQFFVMNQDFFNSLEQEVQDTLLEIGQELTEITPQREMEMVEEAYGVYEEEGVDLYELPEDTAAEWEQALVPVKEDFLQDLNDEGLPGDEVLETWDMQYPY